MNESLTNLPGEGSGTEVMGMVDYEALCSHLEAVDGQFGLVSQQASPTGGMLHERFGGRLSTGGLPPFLRRRDAMGFAKLLSGALTGIDAFRVEIEADGRIVDDIGERTVQPG